MAKPQERIGFVGVSGPQSGADPSQWMNRLVQTDLHRHQGTLEDVVQHLQAEYDIAGRDVLYVEGEGGEIQYQVPAPDVEQEGEATQTGYQALVNPAWEGHEADRPQDTPVWHIATDQYTPVSPQDKYGPLLQTLWGNGSNTRDAFGEFRRYRNGGEIHADIWFPKITVTLAGERHIIGFNTGYDYFGGRALYCEVIAANIETGTALRGIADTKRRRHRGAAGADVAEWWEDMITRAEQATDALAKTVAEAQSYDVEFSALPITSEQYLLAQFSGTEYLAEVADEYLAGGSTPDQASAWALYDAMATALTNEFEGKDGSAALRKYLRRANEQLFSPPSAERTAMQWLEEYEGLAGQQDLEGEEIQAQLREHRISLGDAVDQYESTKETLKRMLNEISDSQEEAA